MIAKILAKFRSLTTYQRIELLSVIVIVCVLLAVLLQKCDKTGIHAQEKATKDAIVQTVVVADTRATKKIDSLETAIDSLSAELAALRRTKATVETRLVSSEKQVTNLVNDLYTAKSKRDTNAYVQHCDSLAIAATALAQQSEAHRAIVDSLEDNYIKQIQMRDSVAAQWQENARSAKAALGQVSTMYDNLYKADLKLQKKAKRRQVGEKLLAALALAVGTYAALK